MKKEYEYLNLLERKLDPRQSDVCCRTDNTIVAAGAGSGKTQVLATRFAWLVMSMGIPASKILTLTFTKKATGEMYERIYKTLSFFANQPETPETEKDRARRALEDFSNVHIQTLDSYCKGIVSQAATHYGIRPDFSVGSSDSETDIKTQALPFVFANSSTPAVKAFASVGNYQKFADDIIAKTIINYTSIITPSDFFTSRLKLQKEQVLKAWNFLLMGIAAEPECPSSLKDAYDEYLSNDKEGLHRAAPNFKDGIDNFLGEYSATNYHGKMYERAGNAAAAFNQISIEDYLLPSNFDFENPAEDVISKITSLISSFDLLNVNIQGLANNDQSLAATIKPLRSVEFLQTYLKSLASYITNYEAIKSMCELLDKFTQQINRQKRLSGNLTFKDVSELSLEILLKHKDIRQHEKNAFDKIMIDEFQDNNGKNRDLLFLISEKDFSAEGEENGCKDGIPSVENIRSDKLFFVGDEKQSIYKFRGAEVSVFNKLKNDLGQNNFLQMEFNYRSDNELITGFNRIFGNGSKIFASNNDKDYEASYSIDAKKYNPKENKVVEAAILNKDNTRIHMAALNTELIKDDEEEKYLDNKNQQAYYIATKIKKMMQELKEKNIPVNYSDFAILERSRQRKELLVWLNYFGIPYQLDQNTNIFTDGPVNDIYNFLRLCVYPADKNAFAVFLSSPFCNLDQKTIETVLLESSAGELPQTENELNEWAEKNLSESSQVQKERFVKGLFYLKQKTSQVLSQKISKTISDLWFETGYQYITMQNTKTDLYSELFDFLFELARECDENKNNISWFVDQLAVVKSKEKNTQEDEEIDVAEVSYPVETQNAVQIMTIHKSKGLQFKYVFVKGCIDARFSSDKMRIFFDEQFGASIKPEDGATNYFAITQKNLSDKKELAEFRRLIYVAITRAISEVYIVGAWNPNSKTVREPKDDEGILKLIENTAIDFYGDELEDKDFALNSIEFKENAPFTYEGINPVTKAEAYSSAASDGNADSPVTKIFDELPSDVEEIPYDEPLSNRKTPSSLEPGLSTDISHDQKHDRSDDALDSAAFTAADFGTLVHDYLRAQAEGIAPEEYQPPVKLFKQLTETEIAAKKAECIKMCHDFAAREYGKAAYASDTSARAAGRLLKAEWAFRMSHEGSIWTGSIDLIYQNADGTYTIIDYKSDGEIVPELYTAQQNCYRIAASKLLRIPEDKIICKLWYLRYNKAVEV
ncbi:exodeoxyribonuclease V subunit beta [Treponema sp. C6A8]|uniref:UvrD-helicase domain-containing protein n=1 Tax=Treponema sp. C6A8 TaxID=1410609 RepID=UPI000485D23D|nr:UvrD-helicase domain-containing protein [Treponema sp. C6A8]